MKMTVVWRLTKIRKREALLIRNIISDKRHDKGIKQRSDIQNLTSKLQIIPLQPLAAGLEYKKMITWN